MVKAALSPILVLSLLVSHRALAGDCGGSGHLLAFPDREEHAPLNAQIRVVMPLGIDAEIRLVPLAGGSVPLARRTIALADQQVWLLQPQTALAPNSSYRVVLSGTPDRTLSTFHTDAMVDRAPPVLTKMSAQFHRLRRRGEKGYVSGSFVTLRYETAEEGPLFLELFEQADSDSAVPRVVKLAARGETSIVFGEIGCHRMEYTFPAHPTLKMAIRAIDSAGNVGPLVPFTVDLAKSSK